MINPRLATFIFTFSLLSRTTRQLHGVLPEITSYDVLIERLSYELKLFILIDYL